MSDAGFEGLDQHTPIKRLDRDPFLNEENELKGSFSLTTFANNLRQTLAGRGAVKEYLDMSQEAPDLPGLRNQEEDRVSKLIESAKQERNRQIETLVTQLEQEINKEILNLPFEFTDYCKIEADKLRTFVDHPEQLEMLFDTTISYIIAHIHNIEEGLEAGEPADVLKPYKVILKLFQTYKHKAQNAENDFKASQKFTRAAQEQLPDPEKYEKNKLDTISITLQLLLKRREFPADFLDKHVTTEDATKLRALLERETALREQLRVESPLEVRRYESEVDRQLDSLNKEALVFAIEIVDKEIQRRITEKIIDAQNNINNNDESLEKWARAAEDVDELVSLIDQFNEKNHHTDSYVPSSNYRRSQEAQRQMNELITQLIQPKLKHFLGQEGMKAWNASSSDSTPQYNLEPAQKLVKIWSQTAARLKRADITFDNMIIREAKTMLQIRD